MCRRDVPAEVVQLVAGVRHVRLADDLRIAGGAGIDVDRGDRVGFLACRVEHRHVGKFFARRLHRHAR
jgi:hypothetical protein